MGRAILRFYAELNDFLHPEDRHKDLGHAWTGRATVGQTIEALGVPRSMVELVLVDGRSVGFSHVLKDGERISVFPVFESVDISPLLRVRTRPLRTTRFVLGPPLARLADLLRDLGFDTLYRPDCDDADLVRLAAEQRRILLTRDPALVKRDEVTRGYWIRESRPSRQLTEVLHRFDLSPPATSIR